MPEGYNNYKHENRKVFLILLAGVIPLLIILLSYPLLTDNYFIREIYENTQSIPVIISSFNPVMTKLMALYCKSAPLLALIAFLLVFRRIKLKKITNRRKLIRSCVLGPFVYTFFAYFSLWHNLDLTIAGRPVRYLSQNDLTLFIFYACLYYALFLITYGIYYLPLAAYKLHKER